MWGEEGGTGGVAIAQERDHQKCLHSPGSPRPTHSRWEFPEHWDRVFSLIPNPLAERTALLSAVGSVSLGLPSFFHCICSQKMYGTLGSPS